MSKIQNSNDNQKIIIKEKKDGLKNNNILIVLGVMIVITLLLRYRAIDVSYIANDPLTVASTPFVPEEFTTQTSNSRTFPIAKGQLNHYRMRPQIINEHVETARGLQATLSSTTPIVGQIFRASQDNINGIMLTLQSGDTIDFDDFESYANDAALQAVWVASDPTEPAELENVIVYEGTQSMAIPSDATVGDEWARSFPSTNFAGWTGTFWFYNDRTYNNVKMRVFIEDSIGNTNSGPIVNQDQDTWEFFEIQVDSLTADGGTPANTTDIVKIGFRLDDRRSNSEVYFDELVSFLPPGSVDVELWDMGATQPVSGVTSLTDGTQYLELGDRGLNGGTVRANVSLDLISGKRQYLLSQYVAGTALEIPSNTLLTPGNYYSIVLRHKNSSINVFGANTNFTTDYYESGYAFNATSVSTPITQIGTYNDLQFIVFSTADVYLNTLLKFYNAQPGDDATEFVNIEDKNMNIVGIIAGENTPQQTLEAEFKDRSFYFPKGGKFEVNHNDDFSDNTTQVTVLIGYMFEPPEVYG